MYDYRNWTPEEQAEAVTTRQERGYAWHGPPHIEAPERYRIITGTCYEHAAFLSTPNRLLWFESELLSHLDTNDIRCVAWVVLPNHYHVLAKISDIKTFIKSQGLLHGRTSFQMNQEDNRRGRKIWHRCQDRYMRNDAHYFATINYIHNNPVKHGYVTKWGDWPYSSYHWFFEQHGRAWLVDQWQRYPLNNYGDGWDD